MIKHIKFMSQAAAEALPFGSQHVAFISITSPEDNPAQLQEFRARLNLKFHDEDMEGSPYGPKWSDQWTYFDRNMALEVINFVESLPDDVTDIWIHCFAGISRSGAVAVFLNEYLMLGDQFLSSYNNYNRHVYRVLCDEGIGSIGDAFR